MLNSPLSKPVTVFLIFVLCASALPGMEPPPGVAPPLDGQNGQKSLVDFFQPVEPTDGLVHGDIWGTENVLPRDINNGLEDSTMQNWCYWDGKIVKDDDQKYHLYASRWSQSLPHSKGWNKGSKGIHAVSNNLLGPYKDLGMAWPHWNQGSGHNVVGLRMHDGRYAMISSEVTPGNVFVSDSPTGPWEHLGPLQVDPNGFPGGLARYNELNDGAVRAGTVGHMANVMIIIRPGGRYMLIARYCAPMISDDGILGPYKILADKAWKGLASIPQYKMEDPTVWYSDGLYHIVVNFHGQDTTYHLTSEDGIHNWTDRGLAFHKDKEIFRYADGVRNRWSTVQRPTVYTEDGLVKCFNFSVIDVHKGRDRGDDDHGSKIVIVPFDGAAFNKHIRAVVEKENRAIAATPAPAPWQSGDLGKVPTTGNTGYHDQFQTFRVRATGNDWDQSEDAFRYVYQKMQGDVSATVLVMAQDISADPVKAGLMLRESLDPSAAFVSVSISNRDGLKSETRPGVGEVSKTLHQRKLRAPYWLRMEKRGRSVSCYISSSNDCNWEKISETTAPFKSAFYVGLAASSINNDSLGLARFKGVDVHPWGSPRQDGVISHSFPNTIPRSGKIGFEVEYESRQPADVFVELQNTDTRVKLKSLRKRIRGNGIMQLVYEIDQELDARDAYWLVLKTIPAHEHENNAIQSTFKKVFVQE